MTHIGTKAFGIQLYQLIKRIANMILQDPTGNAACLESLWKYSLNQTHAWKNDGGNQLSQRGLNLDHRNHSQLCRKEWWLESRVAVSDLPNELHVPETYRESAKATFRLKKEPYVPKRARKRLSPTTKKIQRALATKDSPRIAQWIPENTLPRKSQKSFSAFPRIPLTLALLPMPTSDSSDQITSD